MKNKFIKLISLTFCIAFSLIFLTSCASIEYVMEIFEDGSRVIELSVNVSKSEAGNDLSIIKSETTRAMTEYKETFDNKIIQSKVAVVYSIVITPEEDEKTWKQIIKLSFNSALDYIKAFAVFNNEDVAEKIKAYEDSANLEPDIKETFLYKKQILSKSKNVFSGSISFIEQVETNFRLLNIETASIDFSQVIVYPSEKIKSNANTIIKQDGKSYHLFNFSRENLDETEVEFYVIIPKTSNWYILAIGITACFFGAYFLINYLKSKNNKINK